VFFTTHKKTQNVHIAVKQFIITGRKHNVGPFLSSSLVPLQNDPFCFLLFVLGNQKERAEKAPPFSCFWAQVADPALSFSCSFAMGFQ
jgi:hypothetical protein